MMKKVLKVIGYLVLVLLVAIAGLLSYVKLVLPDVGEAENISVDITAERIERGKYLATSVSVCMDCHSTRDWNRYSGPPVAGTFGKGGEVFNQDLGFPGSFYAKNITPYALSDWTDGEILRAISSGVSKGGDALFPVMPHPNYVRMDREDLYAIIAYLRSLDPIVSDPPESVADFPMNFIINVIPEKAVYSEMPDRHNTVAYGAYLFNAAACNECHTKMVKGKPLEGMELAGGFEFRMPSGGVVRSSNITPDLETGIGKWSLDDFVNRFTLYADGSYIPPHINKGDFNTPMPWMMYATMKRNDLEAIYAYLKTVKPISNKVEKYTP